MNGVTQRFDDRLELLGSAVGVFLVLVGLGTITGMPWTTNGNILISLLQLLGIAGTLGVGIFLFWISHTS